MGPHPIGYYGSDLAPPAAVITSTAGRESSPSATSTTAAPPLTGPSMFDYINTYIFFCIIPDL